MIRDDGKRVVSVDLGPELYSQICQLNALYGVGKTEFLRASVRLTLNTIAMVSKTGTISQREALKTVIERIPLISESDVDAIHLEPGMDELLGDISHMIVRGNPMDTERKISIESEKENEPVAEGVPQ